MIVAILYILGKKYYAQEHSFFALHMVAQLLVLALSGRPHL